MANISELELQNLRHLIGGYDITRCKMEDYASATSDAKLKQFFENGAKDAKKNKEQLMGFLKQERLGWNMQEKTMVVDTLTGINGELTRFGEMIPQTENKELKQ